MTVGPLDGRELLAIRARTGRARIGGHQSLRQTEADRESLLREVYQLRETAGVNGALHRSAEGDVSAVIAELTAIDADIDMFAQRHNPECECEAIQSTREVVQRIRAALSFSPAPTPVTAATTEAQAYTSLLDELEDVDGAQEGSQ